MNFDFLKNLDEKALQKYLWWCRDFQMRGRKYGWLPELQPLIAEGRKKAEELLLQTSK